MAKTQTHHLLWQCTIWIFCVDRASPASINMVNQTSKFHTDRLVHLPSAPQNNEHHLSRVPRSHHRRQPLPSSEGLNDFVDNVPCPTERCYCIKKDGRYYINCKYQQLSAIPTFTRTNISYYELAFNAYNSITSIPTHAFDNLVVERIDLLTNQISHVASGAFAGLGTHLKELYIQGNGQIPVPYNQMLNLVSLRSLRLLSFQQTTINKDNAFSYFPNLEVLMMEDIKGLGSIHKEAFRNKLRKLRHFIVKDVGFTQIPVEGLAELKQLTELNIQETNIDTIFDGSFKNLTNLQTIDLSYNKISMIQENAFQTISPHLNVLILSNNYLGEDSLKSISSQPWNNLQTLSLSYNSGLRNIPSGLFQNMPQLQYLNLVEINLKTIKSHMFAGLELLHSLDLSWNKIEEIKDSPFQNMSTLKHLKLDNQFNNGFSIPQNSLTMFTPGSFIGIEKSLQILELQNTPISPEKFWQIIPKLTEIKEVLARQTRLNYVPEYAFENNVKLEILELDKNNLALLPASFKGLENSLKQISLKDNGIQSISGCTFQGFTKLTDIDLFGNPLHCDCKLTWLRIFVEAREKKSLYLQKEYYICDTPSEFNGRKFYNVTDREMNCPNYVPADCSALKRTTVSSVASTLSTTSISRTNQSVSISLTLAGSTGSSVTVAWSVDNKDKITGYILTYQKTSSKATISVPIHRSGFTYNIRDLDPATYYYICLTPEVHQIQNINAKSCLTIQTKLRSTGTEEQSGAKSNTSDSPSFSSNTMIGIGLASAVVFILIIVGVCMVVKYKMQKLKVIQWSLGRQLAAQGGGTLEDSVDGLDKLKFGTIPNEYMEIDNAKLLDKYKGKGGKKKKEEFDEEGDQTNKRKYASCKKVHKKRPNPYENDVESDEDSEDKAGTDDKVGLQVRHSAPSRLDAKDLLNYNPRNSRPLPALPHSKDQSKTLDRKSNTPSNDTNKARVFVTQASVYETNNSRDSVKDNLTASPSNSSSVKETIIESENENETIN